MKYEYLTPEERRAERERRQQQLLQDLRALELQHYQRELDYRIAAAKDPPDQETMDAARADQQVFDAQYAALLGVLGAFKARSA